MNTMQYPSYNPRLSPAPTIGRRRSSSMSFSPRPVSTYGYNAQSAYGGEMAGHRHSSSYGPGPVYNHNMPSYEDLGVHGNYQNDYQIPMTPSPGIISRRPSQHHRRSSSHLSLSYPSSPNLVLGHRQSMGNFHPRPGSMRVKFRRRNALRDGVMLDECMMRETVSEKKYHAHDLHSSVPLTVLLNIQWSGYSPLRYQVTIDEKSGRIRMQTLARRIARSCIDYFQRNRVPIHWQNVSLLHLEETSYGTWNVVMSYAS